MRGLTDVQPQLSLFISGVLFAFPDDVADVLQDTNYALIAKAGTYDPGKPFLPWAISFAKNQIRAYRTRKGRERLVFDNDLLDLYERAAFAPVPAGGASSRSDHLAECLERLSADERNLIERHYFRGEAFARIAQTERRQESAVRVAVFRIRKSLGDCIDRFCRLGGVQPASAPSAALSSLDALMSDVIDAGPEPGRVDRLLRSLRDEPAAMMAFEQQHRVDYLLTRRAAANRSASLFREMAAPPAVSWRFRFRPVAAAAGIGLILGLAAFAVVAVEGIRQTEQRTSTTVVPATSYQPPATSHKPRATSYEPPATSHEPPATSYPPQATSHEPPATSQSTQETTNMTTNTLTNTIAAAASAVTLAAAVATPASAPAAWTYYTSGESGNPTNVECITDGSWVLGVSHSSTNLTNVKYLSGGGTTLDLSSGVTGSSGTAYAIKSFQWKGFAGKTMLEECILPGNLTSSGSHTFEGCTALRSARYVPAPLFTVFDNGTFSMCPLTNDVAGIIPSFCITLGDANGLAFNAGDKPPVTLCGELVLTNLASLHCNFISNKFSRLLIDSPNLTTTSSGFQYCLSLSNIVLRLPKLLAFDLSFKNCPMTNNVADILDPGVTNIYASCFNGCANMRGCLLLTNLMATAASGDGYCFQDCASLQEIRIGGPLTEMKGTALFKNCIGVTNIVLTAPNLTTVPAFDICTNVLSITLNTPAVTNLGALLGSWSGGNANLREITFGMTNAFTATSGEVLHNCTSLSNVVFQGAMPATTTMDHILGYVSGNSSSSTHACTVYASRSQAGWKDYCAAHPVSDAETAAGKVPADCMGVYVTAGGARKAWIVNYKSPQDGPGGFVIRICESDVAVPYLWITNNLAAADRVSDAAISNALVTAGANGLNRWESYALGLEPDNPASVVLCDAWQDADAGQATFYARNVTPNATEGLKVQYVLEGSSDGVSWPYSLTSTTNALTLPLSSGYSFFRVRADIVVQ